MKQPRFKGLLDAGSLSVLMALVCSCLFISGMVQASTTTNELKKSQSSVDVITLEPEDEADVYQDRLVQGSSFFHVPWVPAPSSTTARDGLGPLFNANTCVSCHQPTQKRQPINQGQDLERLLVFKLSQTEQHATRLAKQITIPDPVYGYQIAINGINGVDFEARPRVEPQYQDFVFADGEKLQLRSWRLKLEQKNYGPLAPETRLSLRVAPMLWGLGLIEAVPPERILQTQTQQKHAYPEMAGKINRVYDLIRQEQQIGRFGWKSAQPSLVMQTADAAVHDMGLSNIAYPQETCTQAQQGCLDAPKGRPSGLVSNDEGFDLSTERLNAIALFVGSIGLPPAKTSGQETRIQQGQALFTQMRCAVCHQPQQITATGEIFKPYSDFLLHNMGPELADARPEFTASTQEWRTAPLWRNDEKSRLMMGFLHDARARNVLEAIAWHGGQASQSREAFRQLNAKQRHALTEFLESL